MIPIDLRERIAAAMETEREVFALRAERAALLAELSAEREKSNRLSKQLREASSESDNWRREHCGTRFMGQSA